MSRKPHPDLDRIARVLGAERRGQVRATGGAFGAARLVAEVQSRFRSLATGGRGTDPRWTERRLLPLSPETLLRLEHLAEALGERGVVASPLQIAALLVERAVGESDDASVADLASTSAARGASGGSASSRDPAP